MQVIFKKYSPAPSFLPAPVFWGVFHKYFPAPGSRLRLPATVFDKIPTFFTIFSNGHAGTEWERNPARPSRPSGAGALRIRFPGYNPAGPKPEYLLISLSFPHSPQTFPQVLFPCISGLPLSGQST